MAVDRSIIIDKMSNNQVASNENGLKLGFDVLITRTSTSLWTDFAAKMVRSVEPELRKAVEDLLINAAHECSYHTGHGLMHSNDWLSIIGPMIENSEDVLHAAFAVAAGFGWFKGEIVELIPDTKMVLRVSNTYEADVIEYGISPRTVSYRILGISAGFMDLAYGKPYPEGLHTFTCKQTKGIEFGDEYSEFVIERANK